MINCNLKKNRNKRVCKSYLSIWTGDYDRDGIKNIDDKYPFDSSRKGSVEPEISLSKAWKGLSKQRKIYKKDIKKLAKKIGSKKYRVKNMYSTINKQMGRNIGFVQDMGALTIFGRDRKDVYNNIKKIKRKFGMCSTRKKDNCITEIDDKYKTALENKHPYMAHHINLKFKGKPFEIQVKTKPQEKIQIEMHKAYKQGKNIRKYYKQAKELYNKGY